MISGAAYKLCLLRAAAIRATRQPLLPAWSDGPLAQRRRLRTRAGWFAMFTASAASRAWSWMMAWPCEGFGGKRMRRLRSGAALALGQAAVQGQRAPMMKAIRVFSSWDRPQPRRAEA